MTQPSTKEQAKKDIEVLMNLPYPNAWNRKQRRSNAMAVSKLPRKTREVISEVVHRRGGKSETAPTWEVNDEINNK